MKFEAHGSYEITLKNNIILMKVSGEWNKQASEKVFNEIRTLIPKINQSTFAKLIDAREWELGTPEFQYLTKQALEDLIQEGLRCEAYIVNDGLLKREQIKLMTPEDERYSRTIVSSVIEAENWLYERGFSLY